MSVIRRCLLLVALLSLLLAQPVASAPTATPARADTLPAAAPRVAAPAAPATPTTPAPTNAWSDAVRTGKWPAQVAASNGAIRPDVHGPQRHDPAAGIPAHAYSPFDERRNRAYPCPSGGCEFVQGQVLVKLAAAVSAPHGAGAAALTSDAALSAALSAQGVTALTPIFPAAQPPAAGALAVTPDGDAVPLPDLTRWQRATLRDDVTDVYALVERLSRTPDIAWAEPDYLRKPVGDVTRSHVRTAHVEVSTARDDVQRANVQTFDDPLYAQQWHLAATNVPQAWDWLANHGLPPGGSRDIVVAVIDTGVDLNHPDLAANLWTNSREIAGNGVDDDGNGYVDDVHGADMITNSGNPLDDHGHGTHVAGIIAAQADNDIGGVGVAYNTQIMAIKAAQYSGVLASSDIAQGINYAVDQGADVINMSFGGYTRSQLEEDALAVAFGQAVLVAAAGNDAKVNLPCLGGRDVYPAAYNWVLGVMARRVTPTVVGDYLAGFSNYDCALGDTHEYEVLSPGVDIWSTLPGAQYAAWDGTSMAAPVVAGIAALARTRWNDKSTYSSRFIMGQIATTGDLLKGITIGSDTHFYHASNALAALSAVPEPSLAYLQHWVFDTTAVAPGNDADGIVDAGETVDLAISIRNQWGNASPVTVTLQALAEGATMPDPYVTMLMGQVNYTSIAAFSEADNGLTYDGEGTITGVEHPFRFSLSADTPNDHVIPFQLTMRAGNGYNPTDPNAPYEFISRFYLLVQRGTELPRIISTDMTLTGDRLWILPDQTLIREGVTVTVTEGAQLQFWSATPDDPYATDPLVYLQVEGTLRVVGTADRPVEMFSGSGFEGYVVKIIRGTNAGNADVQYVRIMNPMFAWASNAIVDHAYFAQEVPGRVYEYIGDEGDRASVAATSVSNSILHHLTTYATTTTTWRNTLFDGTAADMSGTEMHDSVLLMDTGSLATDPGYMVYLPTYLRTVFPFYYGGKSYPGLSPLRGITGSYITPLTLDEAEWFATQLGGYVVTVNDATENNVIGHIDANYLLASAVNSAYPSMDCGLVSCGSLFDGTLIIGLTDQETEGTFEWINGEITTYRNWNAGEPDGTGDYVEVNNRLWYDAALSHYQLYKPFVLELPGEWSDAQLNTVRDAILADGRANARFTGNAILNDWWNTNTSSWLKFRSGERDDAREWVSYISSNYWGNASTAAIEAAIWDVADDFNLGDVHHEPTLEQAPSSTYPFVTDINISTAAQTTTATVGPEVVTFTVTFNRDMDVDVDPIVSFGPATPFTDFVIPGQWTDARTWQGSLQVPATVGGGYQLLRVADAVAADDPWLVTGDDSGRFRFAIDPDGILGMNLQSEGGEGCVELTWTQNDVDGVSGYNVYRSTTRDGAYTRLNPTIIPPDQKTWRDSNVAPAVVYYYYFKVVKFDSIESGPSNIADDMALDTIAPALSHTPVTSAAPGLPLTLNADVTDNVAVQGVTLYQRRTGTTPYSSQAMVKTSGNRYNATLAGAQVAAPGVEYYIEATDGISTVRSGRPEAPNVIAVVDRPVVTAISPNRGPASGGTAVTIAGSNFKAGAAATVGGGACGSLVVVSSSQITCVTPPHFPAAADVVVTNPDSQSGALLRGFTFESDTASLSLPATGGEHSAVVQVPINAANVSGLAAASLTVTFDPAVLSARGAATGSLTPGWALVANTTTPGQVRLSMASPGGAAAGAGVLAYVEFEAIGAAGTSSPLTLTNVALNDGAIPVDTATGSFAIDTVYSVAGTVRAWHGGAGVPSVALTLAGDRLYAALSGASGAYTVSGARADDYTLTPSKADGVNGISAYDASFALQHDAGLITLTGYAFTAGDVNKSGAVTAMDAFYILQKAVDLITLPFPGAGAVWAFDPVSRSYSNLAANQTGQDFTAVLLGDISGNWSPTVTAAGADMPAETAILALQGGVPDTGGLVTATLTLEPGQTPIYALDLALTYDAQAVSVVDVAAASGATGALLQTNLAEPGVIRLALAGAVPLAVGPTADQPLATLGFRLLAPATRTDLLLRAGAANEGAIALTWRGGPLRRTAIYLPLLTR